jgi:phage shock protein E
MDWTVIAIVAAAVIGLLLFKRMGLVSEDTAKKFLKEGGVIVDVRTAGEFKSGHVPEAINIELGELKEDAPRRLPDKDRPILVHCLSGGRSNIARHRLKRMGYKEVHNLGSYSRAEKIASSARA